jgi:hypothetical protein
LFTIDSVLHPVVAAGQQYWFAVTAGPETFAMWTLTWFQGDSLDGGASMLVLGGIPQPWGVGPGTRTGALQVLGDPLAVPEPSYVTLLGAMLATGLKLRLAKPIPFRTSKKNSSSGLVILKGMD